MTPKEHICLVLKTLACSKADIWPVLENMNLSYLAQNHSSVERVEGPDRLYCGKWVNF